MNDSKENHQPSSEPQIENPVANDSAIIAKERRFLKRIAVGACVVWVVMLVVGIVFWVCGKSEELGQLGDAFGAVNALFSGMAFLGAIYAILQQSQGLRTQQTELELQRTEIQLTREEMALQREELKLAREEATKQSLVFQSQLDLARQEMEGAIEPVFNFITPSRDTFGRLLYLLPGGGPVSDLEISVAAEHEGYQAWLGYDIKRGQQYVQFRKDPVKAGESSASFPDLKVSITYINRLAKRRRQQFTLTKDGSRLALVEM